MIKGFTYYKGIAGNAAIRAVIAASQIVFISDGEAKLFPDHRV